MIDADAILDGTDWAELGHAYGSAEDVPERLRALLSEDEGQIAEVWDDLANALTHQESVYPATAPAALFVAAILTDPRTDVRFQGRPLRAELIDWLEIVAAGAIEAGDEFDEPGIAECTAVIPQLRESVTALAGDPDESIRESAETFLETTADEE
ncbi:hypothetical protein Ait01nite_080040 [Actinoplanes italicus]|uniref:Uncharacterized protein n=1 Tax=Actinoplanes italicus TaxID=113567 RepID=A0A2T0JR54_9ACTN|nr:hypothetical protein [Actinoplanes italicus]PRX10121.1 hypothetical protein CLV67_1345 [Actinoplanes italicus]GIE34959.1 hypothetical protein Ait01nite_080040 [Actinoplanes italicus]